MAKTRAGSPLTQSRQKVRTSLPRKLHPSGRTSYRPLPCTARPIFGTGGTWPANAPYRYRAWHGLFEKRQRPRHARLDHVRSLNLILLRLASRTLKKSVPDPEPVACFISFARNRQRDKKLGLIGIPCCLFYYCEGLYIQGFL